MIEKIKIPGLVKFCGDVAADEHYPDDIRIKAKKLRAECLAAQTMPSSSPKQKDANERKLQLVLKRMTKFERENR